MRQKKKEMVENERGSNVRLDDGVGPFFWFLTGFVFCTRQVWCEYPPGNVMET